MTGGLQEDMQDTAVEGFSDWRENLGYYGESDDETGGGGGGAADVSGGEDETVGGGAHGGDGGMPGGDGSGDDARSVEPRVDYGSAHHHPGGTASRRRKEPARGDAAAAPAARASSRRTAGGTVEVPLHSREFRSLKDMETQLKDEGIIFRHRQAKRFGNYTIAEHEDGARVCGAIVIQLVAFYRESNRVECMACLTANNIEIRSWWPPQSGFHDRHEQVGWVVVTTLLRISQQLVVLLTVTPGAVFNQEHAVRLVQERRYTCDFLKKVNTNLVVQGKINEAVDTTYADVKKAYDAKQAHGRDVDIETALDEFWKTERVR